MEFGQRSVNSWPNLHKDGTYKITIYGLPLVVYGVSDQYGQLHPVSFMITNHEAFDVFFG